MIYYASSTGEQEVNGHEKKDCRDRRGEMHGLRAVRERLPRGRDCDGGRKGEARQGRLLRRHGRLPAGVSCRCDQNRRARGRRIRRKGRAGAEDGEDAGTDEVRRNGSASGGTYSATRRLPRQGDAPVQPCRCATSDPPRQLSTHNSKLSTFTVDMPDSPGAGQGAVLPRCEVAHRRRLHGLRLRELPSGVYARQGDDCRMPQARSR